MTLQIGEVIKDRYRIVQILGSGGMGIVYRAKDESLGIDVAIKEPFTVENTQQISNQNTSLLAQLHHPAIPRVTDVCELKDGRQLLVMDFIPGEDLKSRVETNGPLALGDAVRIITTVGSALQYLHNHLPPIIHQDVKPGNIQLTPGGKALLVDFDLAFSPDERNTQPPISVQGLTPGFAAPEQYNRMVCQASDQYALAATLYFLLTGLLLPDGLSRASGNNQIPNLSKYRIPLDILTCLEKALSINPSDRYSDIQAFLDSLNAVIKTELELTHTPTRKLFNKNTNRKRTMLWAIAFFFTGIVILGVVNLRINYQQLSPTSALIVTITPGINHTPVESTAVAAMDTPDKTPVTNNTITPNHNTEVEIKPTPLGGGTGIYAFVSEKKGMPQIFLGSIDDREIKQITDIPEGACQPDWSPDGKRIVFVSPCLPKAKLTGKPEPYSGSGLFILLLDDNQIIPIPSQPGGDFDPAWSPDGEKIAFTSIREKTPGIYIHNLADESTYSVTNHNYINRQPAWSPDGQFLAASSNQFGSLQIWLMGADGAKRIAFSVQNNGSAFFADWSPDGKSIVYSQTNSLRLVEKNIDNQPTTEKILNNRLTYAANPDISPDGNWILFDSNMGGVYQVYRISHTGSGSEPLSSTEENSYQPVWKPGNRN
ncbi:protein kinase domain-containing protein [Leptolinea tardivitalis]|uniref:protein kinase domain-containing protein n=1 Tax=Leptolinea tardivitalis TaxID=229920 RepID=UPI000781CB6A|nr:protein kinase [Leptolinea tardivitalis]GAP21064.1 periplasmic component of the Tol biopolymer transport system [Leptolinea tardivitalis]